MRFEELVRTRYSCRSFQDKAVPRDTIYELIKLATHAPTSCNLQNFSFIIIDDSKLLERLTREISYKFNYSRSFIIVTMQKELSVKRSAGYVSAGFISDHILLGAASQGISSLAMAGFGKDKRLSKILGIPNSHSIVLLIALGWANSEVNFRSSRVSAERLVGFNSFNPGNTLNTSMRPKLWSLEEIADYRSRIGHVYLDRLRLNSVPNYIYEMCAKQFINEFNLNDKKLKLLDLITYDGQFLEELKKALETKNFLFEITPSDFDQKVLAFHNERHNSTGLLLSKVQQNSTNSKFDFVTSIFQINHFPNWEWQLKYAFDSLMANGGFYLTIYQDGLLKNFARRIRYIRLSSSIKPEKVVNVYENSVYYKSGPFSRISLRSVRRKLIQLGFSDVAHRKIKVGSGIRKNTLIIIIAKKK